MVDELKAFEQKGRKSLFETNLCFSQFKIYYLFIYLFISPHIIYKEKIIINLITLQ